MATYFIDLDGVFFKYGTMKPCLGAIHFVNKLKKNGHKIIFITARVHHNNNAPELNLFKTKKVLKKLGVEYDQIIEGSSSPRIIINDEGSIAINHKKNRPLLYNQFATLDKEFVAERMYNALAAINWVSWKYRTEGDPDDYVQTLTIANSLIEDKGFNHKNIVKRYRTKPNYKFKNILMGGLHPNYKGQIYKLLQSDNPLYIAKGGVSDGAAMKVAPITAFYLDNFEKLVKNTDKITKITHNTVEARLSAILIVLRFRQIFLIKDTKNIDGLINDLKKSIKILKLEKESKFFLRKVEVAAELTKREEDPTELLIKLAKEIGLEHLTWSTPVSACFWSYKSNNNFPYWFNLEKNKKIRLVRKRNKSLSYKLIHIFERYFTITSKTLKKKVVREYKNHLIKINQFGDYLRSHNYNWRRHIDVDTFFSISFSLIAAEHGIEPIKKELKFSTKFYDDDLKGTSSKLVSNLNKKSFDSNKDLNN